MHDRSTPRADPVETVLCGSGRVGMIFLGDTVSTAKLASIALILAGVAGLNLSGVTP
jgi:multidrug transporter EmrE-like cation transporter